MPYIEPKIDMPEKFQALYEEMLDTLSAIERQENKVIVQLRRKITALRTIMEKLRKLVYESNFQNEQEEIFFFKFIKPRFNSQLIFALKVYRYETTKPIGSTETQKKYISKNIEKAQLFLEEEASLYAYFNSGASYLDHLYFTRGIKDVDINYRSYTENADNLFSTAQDYTISKFLATEMLITYFEEQLSLLSQNIVLPSSNDTKLNYVGKNVWLVEWIYGWYYAGLFKDADLKDIAAVVQKITNTNLGNFYRTMQELRIRQKDETIFQICDKALKKGKSDADANPRY